MWGPRCGVTRYGFLYGISRFLICVTDRFTLAHLTVKEFLLQQDSQLRVNEAGAHSFIARSCLTYLLDQFQPCTIAGVGESLSNYLSKIVTRCNECCTCYYKRKFNTPPR
jgi:hypothetical protein